MFSDSPGTPGFSAQTPRTIRSTFTPACEGFVQRRDHRQFQQRIHLRDDARTLAGACVVDLGADRLDDARMQRERRLPQLVQRQFAADAGQLLEYVVDVLADLLVGRHQPEVGVQARRARMVVAGAEVHVAAQRGLAALHHASHDQHHLRVALVSDDAVL